MSFFLQHFNTHLGVHNAILHDSIEGVTKISNSMILQKCVFNRTIRSLQRLDGA
jgi:hypothetical protein